MKKQLSELREAATVFARLGGEATLNHFKKSFKLEFKEDDSPVTNADREAERVIRREINKNFPGHGIIGEEYGVENEDSEIVWVLDPIDGTKSFIHGIPFYTTLIGVMIRKQPEVGVIYVPALDEMVTAASGQGATLNGEAIHARECNDLSKATFLSTEVSTFYTHGFKKPFEELLKTTRVHRTWGDAYGHMMVAVGRADIMIDPILSIWDAAALFPVLKEAGASFTDLKGEENVYTGNGLSVVKGIKENVLNIFE